MREAGHKEMLLAQPSTDKWPYGETKWDNTVV